MIVLSIAWLFLNKKIASVLLLLFFGGYKNLAAVFAFNNSSNFHLQKDSTCLRVLSWNVRGFDNNSRHAESPDSARRKMISFLKQANADILLLQELVDYKNDAIYSNFQMLHDSLGYRYFYASEDLKTVLYYGPYETGSGIFSKIPLLDTTRMCYDSLPLRECAISADVVFLKKRLRLMTTHLISMNLRKGHLDRTDEAFKRYDSAFIFGSSRFTKLTHYDSVHSSQALALRRLANASTYPLLISGDFNSTPSSFTYHTIKGNLQDAFLEKGFGIGRTYSSLSPTLRIDYVLLDERLEVVQYHCPYLYLSDHFPIITDVRWR
jgi:endonuclease/exonuclease/phosphatase family metal-dependent hydrolase